MNVLSLFDGMSCGQIALERAGISVDNYFASEIEPSPIKVCLNNYPSTKQIGDVTNIDVDSLPFIDLLIGGSPCQGFSSSGDQSNFEHSESRLFYEYTRILNALRAKNPNIKFLLENVKMKKQWLDVITSNIGVEPIYIDSQVFCAQMRKRFYWTNIPVAELPKESPYLMKDIIDETEINPSTTYYGGGSKSK